MITTIRVVNVEEAKTAIKMLEAYLMAFGNEEVAETPVNAEPEKPKTTRKRTTKPKEEKEVPATRAKDAVKKDEKPKPEPKTEVEESGGVTLPELTKLGKEAVARTGDKVLVKNTIAEYGARLSAVAEADYHELADKLKAL